MRNSLIKAVNKLISNERVQRLIQKFKWKTLPLLLENNDSLSNFGKYDKDALDEAVRSVRRGEMSVHRAGSFYGVPHSTLEYKVKERNLLRSKRRKNSEEGCDTSTKRMLFNFWR